MPKLRIHLGPTFECDRMVFMALGTSKLIAKVIFTGLFGKINFNCSLLTVVEDKIEHLRRN